MSTAVVMSFHDCRLDVPRHELWRDGAPVAVEPQVFDVLAYLVEHRDRMVTKIELLDEIWGDRFVSESALSTRIKSVRRAVGDDGRAQRIIKTVHGRGYRFVADVLEEELSGPPAAAPPWTVSEAPLEVTFLFTDIESSSASWERNPAEMNLVLADHDRLLTEVLTDAGGRVFKHTGDGLCCAFADPAGAVRAAVDAQHRLQAHAWPSDHRPRVRIGVHRGPAYARDDDYFGPGVNQVARVLDTGNGDQIVASAAVLDDVPDDVVIGRRGELVLVGLDAPLAIVEITSTRFANDPRALRLPTGGSDDRPLSAVLARLGAGGGVAVALSGPPGSGKSDVLAEVLDAARLRGYLVGSGSAALNVFRPGGAVIDALDELAQREPSLLERVPATCAAELRRCFDNGTPTSTAKLVFAARELLLAATDDRPTVVVIDDVHYGGEATTRLIRSLGPMTRQRPLALVVAHRGDLDVGPGFERVVLDASPGNDDTDFGATLPDVVADALARVALGGDRFDRLEFDAASGSDGEAATRLIDAAIACGAIAATADGYRFTHPAQFGRLVEQIPPAERLEVRRRTALGLAERDAAPERVAEHYLAAGDIAAAVRPATAAARAAMASHSYADARRWIDAVVDAAAPDDEYELRLLEADVLAATGDLDAVPAYRRLIDRTPAAEVALVRTKLARAALLSGDLATAEESLRGLEPDGGPADGQLLLAQGMLAYFRGDMEEADRAASAARELALRPGAPSRLLDAISLQGLISHSTGEWFDRLHREMRANRDHRDLLTSVFDAHLCVAEYMLYGPTPYDDVMEMAHSLADAATRAGANPAVAFALSVSGEAALLKGDLDAAREDLQAALELHREMGASTGEAHTMQRLAEVEHAAGNRSEAHEMARRALAIGRWAPLANHLMQRAYGTVIATSPTTQDALATAQEAVDTLDEPTSCEICDVMLYVPMTAAFADAGQVDDARWALERAERSASFWHGSAWPAAIAEARACIARAEGNHDEADDLLRRAERLFVDAGQLLDAARCREEVESALA